MTNHINRLAPLCSPLHEKYRTSRFLNLRKNRSLLEILALILEAGNDNGAAQHVLMKYANTSYVQLKKYLGALIEMNFMEMHIKDGRVLYKTNEKGKSFLTQYHVLLSMLVNAQMQNKSASVVYGAKYGPYNLQQQPATQIVKHLQHAP